MGRPNRHTEMSEREVRYRRNWKLERKYGITLAAYESMLKRQGGRCALCGKLPKPERTLCVDHCHTTKVVRGLLCDMCNRSIGWLGDDVQSLERVVQYLEKSDRR